MSDQEIPFDKQADPLHIRKDMVVRIKYAMSDISKGETLAYRDDLYYLHGGYGGALPKVEEALEGCAVGDSVEVTLTPAEAYGELDPDLVVTQPEENFPPEARELGTRLDAEGPDGRVLHFTVSQVENGMIMVNGNHPLAGKHLRFVMEVLDIRPANETELSIKHAMPPHIEEAFEQFQ